MRRQKRYLISFWSKNKLFMKIKGNSLLGKFKPWVAIAYLEKENLEDKLKSLDDWDFNVKNLRNKRKELERIPDTYKIDCVVVSVVQFKNSADEILQSLVENLSNSLKNSLKKECEAIDEFVTKSLEMIANRPKTFEEISKSKEDYYKMKGKQAEYENKISHLEEKNKML